MLLEFKFSNARSFADTVNFSLLATNQKEHQDTLIKVGNYKVVPFAILFGANASGKTNLLNALFAMCNKVLNIGLSSRLFPFMLDDTHKNEPAEMEVKLIVEQNVYRYGFVIESPLYASLISKEWLYFKPVTAPKTKSDKVIFERQKNGESKWGNVTDDLKTMSSMWGWEKLFLSAVGAGTTIQSSDIKNVYRWFSKLVADNYGDDNMEQYAGSVEEFSNNVESKQAAVSFIQKADPSIVDLKIDPDGKISYSSRTLGEDNNLIVFSGNLMSSGTKKMIKLFSSAKKVLENGGVLLVDELDAKLHPILQLDLLNLFSDSQINTKNAQLVYTSHNPVLMNKDFMRRDQIWLVDRNPDTMMSSLKRLSDKDVRSDADYLANYLRGNYGAIPLFEMK